MAYMNQEKKAAIAEAVAMFVPDGWKYSLAVRNHSTIVMTITSAPINLTEKGYVQVNRYQPDYHFQGDTLAIIREIISALNTGNWDRSDSQTDYFDVGHYIDLEIGRWNKPFVCTASA